MTSITDEPDGATPVDLTPPPVYRTLVRDPAQATFRGPFDTTSPQTEGAGQRETFGGGD